MIMTKRRRDAVSMATGESGCHGNAPPPDVDACENNDVTYRLLATSSSSAVGTTPSSVPRRHATGRPSCRARGRLLALFKVNCSSQGAGASSSTTLPNLPMHTPYQRRCQQRGAVILSRSSAEPHIGLRQRQPGFRRWPVKIEK